MAQRHDANLADAARICFQHMEFITRYSLHHFAANRNTAENREDQPADCIDILTMLANDESGTDLFRNLIKIGPGIGNEYTFRLFDDHHFIIVMLVFNVADNHLDDIFQRNQTIGSAIFINDKGNLDALRLHPAHQIIGKHRWRHEQDRPHQAQF